MRNATLSNSRPALILWYDLEETIGWPSGEQPSGCRAPSNPAARLAALAAAVKAPYPTPQVWHARRPSGRIRRARQPGGRTHPRRAGA